MELYRVSFFGHRTIFATAELERLLEERIRELIRTKAFVEFYVGRNGDFDILVASVIKRIQKREDRSNSAMILTLPYPVKDMEDYANYYDEIVIPVEQVHYKAVITKRNEWMVENSDLVIGCVQKKSGGAARALQYAEKQGIPVINLGKELPAITD